MSIITAKEIRHGMPRVNEYRKELDKVLANVTFDILMARDKGYWNTDVSWDYIGEAFESIVVGELQDAGYVVEHKSWTCDDNDKMKILKNTYNISWNMNLIY